MTVIGVHDMVDALARYARGALRSDGGLWLMLMDGLLLVPLGMAVFFYPVTAVFVGVALAAVTLGAVMVSRTIHGSDVPRAHPPERVPV